MIMNVKMIGVLLCSVLLNCSTVMAQARYDHVLEKAEEFQFINYPAIDQMIESLKQTTTELRNKNEVLFVEVNKIMKEKAKIKETDDPEVVERVEKMHAEFRKYQDERGPILTQLGRYAEFLQLIEKRKSKIIREENFVRNGILCELKKELPNELYKETPFYRQIIKDPSLELTTQPSLIVDALDIEFISKCNGKMRSLFFDKAWKETVSHEQLKEIREQVRTLCKKRDQRLEYLASTVPEIKECYTKYHEIKDQIDAQGYDPDEIDRQYRLQLDTIVKPHDLSLKLDENYRENFKELELMNEKKHQMILELWAESKSESFMEYCKWLTLKAKHRAYHQLAEQRK